MQSSWGHVEAPEEYREEILDTFARMSSESSENPSPQS
jgi:hypothetical protein